MNSTTGYVTFVCSYSGQFPVTANVTYIVALYGVASTSTAPTPAPSVTGITPTANPNQVTYIATSAPATVALPSESGIAGSLSVPAAGGTGTITGTASTSASGASLPAISGTDISSVLYTVSLSASSALSFPGGAGVSFTVPSASLTANGLYYLATYDSTNPTVGWLQRAMGPGVVTTTTSGATITFTAPLGITLAANSQYGFALYLSTATSKVTVSGSTQTVALGTVGGISGSLTMPAGVNLPAGSFGNAAGITSIGNVIATTVGASPATGIPALPTSAGTPLYVVSFQPSAQTSFAAGAGITFTLPSAAAAGTNYYLAVIDPYQTQGWLLGFSGTVSGSTVSFNSAPGYTFSSHPYAFALYSTTGATPAPVPTTNVTLTGATCISGNPCQSFTTVAPVALPSAGGWSATLQVGTLNVGSVNSTTNSVVVGTIGANTAPFGAIPPPNNAAYLVYVVPQSTTWFGGTTTAVVTAPSTAAAGTYFLEVYDSNNPSAGWFQQIAQATLTNGTLTFTYGTPFVLTGGSYYGVAISQ